ncbi:23956_t:CDS:2, partial [Dentiscutata erythropus]
MSIETLPDLPEQLETHLKSSRIKSFDFSQFRDIELIGSGNYATVYSATFNGQIYALKSLRNNLNLEDKTLELFKREIKQLYTIGEREEIVNNTPLSYANLIRKCWSAEPDQRPSLYQVLVELNKLLMETPVEFIVNPIKNSSGNNLAKSNTSVNLDSSIRNSIETNTTRTVNPEFEHIPNEASEFSEELEIWLKSSHIKSFDYPEFKDVKLIGRGGFAVVYSATFNGQIYALKSFNLNLKFEDNEFEKLKRE